ncbi:MAG: DUF4926 domain-containing protein [Stygiobacter sp. RIFOXYC12_FULL_38_8]|nr:MAG: DUF4926 domain-containing protein [Stygiobacter sp. GWC2_38_9]OGU84665.1 MAG: DUF4926 domain-containing protein [Stygiobacter sp. RIFOXYA12_FULL_38_9]OGV08415.1 MAG: DUF4926 domain-containing protein [Stygiobacter sp. RIFOXYB2_FULL_37_11]OGV13980.1 MAG: DUF4926 domain-containing protein [Stygiobacter sp. RIFOXYA2_FULL_38_8]OGV14418.1 MAG: DUF4926 domain-containing protein [Stygiobacter sp. RIFOXYC2_FULL_38_25]OGV29855.1 MAG: DUF4926 domain-containing protein [Stygiobacter sp. RIFOXYC12
MKENEIVVLAVDLPQSGLKSGDIGTIVMCHKNNTAYEVEFVKFNGETISVETLNNSQIRPVANDEIPHVRLIKVA